VSFQVTGQAISSVITPLYVFPLLHYAAASCQF